MPTDKSEPRTGLIIKIGVAATGTLILTHAALTAYFDRTAEGEEYRKIGSAKPAALMDVRASEQQRLSAGPMPIDKAMQTLKERNRGGASPDIMPSASMDMAPMQGWVKMPAEVPMPMAAAASAASATPAPAESAAPAAAAPDAGPDAAAKRDGGAPPTLAPKHPNKQL